MGSIQVYRCADCGNKIRAHAGGGFCFIEYRCVDCDTIKVVKCNNQSVPEEEWIQPEPEGIGACLICGGELSDDIGPMCQRCKSRNIKEIEDLRDYD